MRQEELDAAQAVISMAAAHTARGARSCLFAPDEAWDQWVGCPAAAILPGRGRRERTRPANGFNAFEWDEQRASSQIVGPPCWSCSIRELSNAPVGWSAPGSGALTRWAAGAYLGDCAVSTALVKLAKRQLRVWNRIWGSARIGFYTRWQAYRRRERAESASPANLCVRLAH